MLGPTTAPASETVFSLTHVVGWGHDDAAFAEARGGLPSNLVILHGPRTCPVTAGVLVRCSQSLIDPVFCPFCPCFYGFAPLSLLHAGDRWSLWLPAVSSSDAQLFLRYAEQNVALEASSDSATFRNTSYFFIPGYVCMSFGLHRFFSSFQAIISLLSSTRQAALFGVARQKAEAARIC